MSDASCTLCSHADHPGKPCGTCAVGGSTCWQPVLLTGGDGDRAAKGAIEMAAGTEARPCCMCRSWEGGEPEKLTRYLLAKGLKPNAAGKFETPIAKDFKGRKSLEIDPKSYGYCRRDGIPTDMLATCENWKPTITEADFKRRMRRA